MRERSDGKISGKISHGTNYEKVKNYGDIENRDIWEYRLDLTAAEIRRMLAHVWEFRSAHFDYFFLDENCSYHLLSLLEAARPSLNLTDRFEWWAIPADTIRALVETPGLVKDVEFRPSRRTVLRYRTLGIKCRSRRIAKDLAEKKISVHSKLFTDLAPVERARALELSAEYLAYLQESEFFDLEIDENHLLELLTKRSELDVPSQAPRIDPPRVRPDQGHESSRIGVGYGYEGSNDFLQFELRPVFHDLFDPQGGFVRGAQLEFFDTALRYYPDENKLNLERLHLIDIVFSTPIDQLLKIFSWEANAGFDRKRFADNERSLVGLFNAGLGVGYDFFDSETLVCVFGEEEALVSGRFDESVALGAGFSLNIFHDLSQRWRIGVSMRLLEFFQGIHRATYDISLGQRLTLSDRMALRFEVSRKREFGRTLTPAILKWQVYF